MIYKLEETTSTNDDARAPHYRHGDVVWAERQTAGRGQRGHTWSSPEGENLTFSVVLEPGFLPVQAQFLLLETVALALCDTFEGFGIATRIKWTNDIYAGDRKLVGILTEHFYSGPTLGRTVVGIGINVNQTRFDPALPNPVSMAQLTGLRYDRAGVLDAFLAALGRRYAALEGAYAVGGEAACEALERAYCSRMYRLDSWHWFREPGGEPFEAAIRGVGPAGALRLEHRDGTLHDYLFRQVEFIVARASENEK